MISLRNFKLSKREQIMCAVTVFALAFGYTKWVVLRKTKEIASVGEAAKTLQSSSVDLTGVIAAIEIKRKPASVPSATAAPDLLPQYLSTSASLGSLLKQLTDEDPTEFYNVKGIQGKTVPLDTTSTASKHYELVSYEVQLETSFLSMGKFVEKLENSKFVLDIVSVEVKRIEADLKRCSATIRLNSYVPKAKS